MKGLTVRHFCCISFSFLLLTNSTISATETNLVYEDVVGGIPVDTAVPFYAIGTTNGALCGAVLIHAQFLLTAAHCQEAFAEGGRAYLAPTTTQSKQQHKLPILRTLPHPNYNPITLHNDIMLVQLQTPIRNARTAQLPTDEQYTTNLSVLGFGSTVEGGPPSTILRRAAPLRVVYKGLCRALYSVYSDLVGRFYDGMLCAMSSTRNNNANGLKDACQGDSGGPVRRLPVCGGRAGRT